MKYPLPGQSTLPIDAAKAAARQFIDQMRPVDTVSIHAFNSGFRVIHEFSGDKASLKRALAKLAPTTDTFMYDALIKSVGTFKKPPEDGGVSEAAAPSIVLLSDGKDDTSVATLDKALAEVRAAGVRVYTVGLRSKTSDPAALQKIATASGAIYREAVTPE
jgi:Ca-activated chloride channel family protein